MKNTFKGVFTAMITPFTEYNTVDYISLSRDLSRHRSLQE